MAVEGVFPRCHTLTPQALREARAACRQESGSLPTQADAGRVENGFLHVGDGGGENERRVHRKQIRPWAQLDCTVCFRLLPRGLFVGEEEEA